MSQSSNAGPGWAIRQVAVIAAPYVVAIALLLTVVTAIPATIGTVVLGGSALCGLAIGLNAILAPGLYIRGRLWMLQGAPPERMQMANEINKYFRLDTASGAPRFNSARVRLWGVGVICLVGVAVLIGWFLFHALGLA